MSENKFQMFRVWCFVVSGFGARCCAGPKHEHAAGTMCMDQIITSLNHLWKILMSFLEIIFQLLCANVRRHSENLIITSSSLHHHLIIKKKARHAVA